MQAHGSRCPICAGTDAREVYALESARHIPGPVVRCTRCRLLYKVLAASAKPLTEYYGTNYAASDYWNNEESTTRALEPLARAASRVADPSTSTLLDIGCGPGAFLKLAKADGFQVCGFELNPILAQRAREAVGVEVLEGDFVTAELGARRFKVITMLDLIEHLLDPLQALRRCHDLLEPGGHLVVYTPNHSSLVARTAGALHHLSRGKVDGPMREIFDCLHVVFFDVATLQRALTTAGFSDVETSLITYDPDRSRQAKGVSALVLRTLESVSPVIGGPFRILAIAARPRYSDRGTGRASGAERVHNWEAAG